MSEAVRTEIFTSAPVTAAGNTAAFNIPTAAHLFVGIDITAWGTVGPVFFFQVSDDGGTTWYDHPIELQMTTLATGAAGTATVNSVSYASTIIGKVLFNFKNLAADKYRLRWTVASGSATFSASAVAK
jgi:hypothetical protein